MNKSLQGFLLIKRLPNSRLLVLLIFLSGLMEGIGISALLPVVNSLTNNSSFSELNFPFNLAPQLFQFFGVEPDFKGMLIVCFLLMSLSFVFIYFQERLSFYSRYEYLRKLRKEAVESVFASKWENITKMTSGDIANRIIHESDRGAESIVAFVNFTAIGFQLIVYGVFAFLLSWKMTIVAGFIVGVAGFCAKRLIKKVRNLGENSVSANSKYSFKLVEYFRGIKLLKVMGLEKSFTKDLEGLNTTSSEALKRIVYSSSKMKLELQLMISFAMIIILLSSVEVFNIEVSILLVFMYILMRLAPKFSSLQGQLHSYSASLPGLVYVDDLISSCRKQNDISSEGGETFFELKKGISFSGVSFYYDAQESPALEDVTLTFRAKTFSALVGTSGSGKTTTLDLILGLIRPTKGNIDIDGVNLNDCDLLSFRKRIGFVPQESVFFSGSLFENLCLGESVEESWIWDCLEMAQIKDFVLSLPQKLSTLVGESGMTLSGGQRQRLAIARALIRKPEVLILDEATSSLDSQSEALLQKAIDSISNRFTIVVIAHRLSTIKNAHQIYVFEKGHVIDQGTFEELRKSEGLFSKLLHHQQVES